MPRPPDVCSVIFLCSAQVVFRAAGDEEVSGVDHVSDVEFADLGEKLVAVECVEALFVGELLDEFEVGCTGGALDPVAGIMIADFYLVRCHNYDLTSFYDGNG